ncbi:hypothetical protein ACWU4D_09060 [Vibrio sp. WJH972]
MSYFTYITEQAFGESPDGKRLFYCSGPWSRPYIVPDVVTEKRLFQKQLWKNRIFFSALIVGQPFLFSLIPEMKNNAAWLCGYLVLLALVSWCVSYFALRKDLVNLNQSDRLRFRAFFVSGAKRHQTSMLVLGYVACLLFVMSGVWMIAFGRHIVIAWIVIVFFSVCSLAWGYAIYVKKTLQE